MKLIIKDDEDRKTVVPIVRDEISIGRQEGNTIRLTERNVSRRHARLLRQNGHVYVEDLNSYNGVRVNGDRINARTGIREGDSIEIGDYLLEIEGAPTAGDGDTNPTGNQHIEAPKDKTPPLAVQPPQQRQPAPAPAAPPKRDSNATAVIRLSDLQRSGGDVEVRDLAPHEQPRIVCIAGQMRGQEFRLKRTVSKFGRTDEGNDLTVDHQSISRSHGRFQLEDTGWKLYDNKSANGVRVNGDEYEMSPVKSGDTIELGHVKFRFVGPGEAFSLPRETAAASAPTTAAAPVVEQAAPAKSKTGLIVGLVGGVVVLVGVVVFLLLPKGPPPPDPTVHCTKGQAAIGMKNWDGAISEFGVAKAMNAQCSFDLDGLLKKARSEKQVKELLDEATILMEEGKFRQVIQQLKGVPADSDYSAESQLKATEARREGVRRYTEDAQRNVGAGRLDEAGQAADDIEAIDPEASVLPILRKQIADAKSRKSAAAERASAAPPEKPLEERNRTADQFINEGIRQIKAGDITKAVGLLNKARAEKPAATYVAKACRTLGIAHARAGENAQAIEAYKCYLAADPNTPERQKIMELIKKAGG